MFGRRKPRGPREPVEPAGAAAAAPAAAPRAGGPWDVAEVDLDHPAQAGLLDLGGLLVRGAEGMALQLELDEASGAVRGAVVVSGDAAVAMVALAAPRHESLWEDISARIEADVTARGGSVERAEGPLGAELHLRVPVRTPDGGTGIQPTRVVGVDGPRWLLQASFLGRATVDEAAFARLAEVVRATVVVRGDEPMAPGDRIPLRLPEQVQAAADADADADPNANADPNADGVPAQGDRAGEQGGVAGGIP